MKHLHRILGVVMVAVIIAALAWQVTGAFAQGGEGGDVTYTWAGDVNAPDFPEGADWINVSAPVSIADLRGKIVLLDFL